MLPARKNGGIVDPANWDGKNGQPCTRIGGRPDHRYIARWMRHAKG